MDERIGVRVDNVVERRVSRSKPRSSTLCLGTGAAKVSRPRVKTPRKVANTAEKRILTIAQSDTS